MTQRLTRLLFCTFVALLLILNISSNHHPEKIRQENEEFDIPQRDSRKIKRSPMDYMAYFNSNEERLWTTSKAEAGLNMFVGIFFVVGGVMFCVLCPGISWIGCGSCFFMFIGFYLFYGWSEQQKYSFFRGKLEISGNNTNDLIEFESFRDNLQPNLLFSTAFFVQDSTFQKSIDQAIFDEFVGVFHFPLAAPKTSNTQKVQTVLKAAPNTKSILHFNNATTILPDIRFTFWNEKNPAILLPSPKVQCSFPPRTLNTYLSGYEILIRGYEIFNHKSLFSNTGSYPVKCYANYYETTTPPTTLTQKFIMSYDV